MTTLCAQCRKMQSNEFPIPIRNIPFSMQMRIRCTPNVHVPLFYNRFKLYPWNNSHSNVANTYTQLLK